MTLDHSYFEEMEAKIPHGKVRTRFAPSPTGYMHVGNLRTALYPLLMLYRRRVCRCCGFFREAAGIFCFGQPYTIQSLSSGKV